MSATATATATVPPMPTPGKCLKISAILAALGWFVFSGWAVHLLTVIRETTAAPATATAIVGSLGVFALGFFGCYIFRLGNALANPFSALPKTLPPDPAEISEPGVQPIDATPQEPRRPSFSSMSDDELENFVASATEQQRSAFSAIVSLHGQIKARLGSIFLAVVATAFVLTLVSPHFENGWFVANMIIAGMIAIGVPCIRGDVCPASVIARYGNRAT